MKKIIFLISLFALFYNCPVFAQPGKTKTKAPHGEKCFASGQVRFDHSDDRQRMSYMLGRDFWSTVKETDFDLDFDLLLAAVFEAADGHPPQFPDSVLSEIKNQFKRELREMERQKRRKLEADNEEASMEFLAANKKKPGVVETESGLQYKVIHKGSGPKPNLERSRVKIHYHGTLADGTVFDSSRERGEPMTFQIGAMIKGWTEALQLMREGSKYKIFVPPDLAYGRRGARSPIGPNMVLVFEIELLEIVSDGSYED